MPTLVAVAHGSRDPRAADTARALLRRVRELRPGLPVRLAHIELTAPLLGDALAGLRGAPGGEDDEAVLVPLLLGRGHHTGHDLPRAAAAAAAAGGPRCRVAAPLGPHPLIVEALCDRLLDTGWTPNREGAAVVLACAGSRDPRYAADARAAAALLSERLGGVPVLPGYASAAAPTVPEALRALAARGHHRTAVASYFAAPGRFAAMAAAAGGRYAAEPLGDHPAMARLVLHRYLTAPAAVPVPARPPLTTAVAAA
ncbi:sirohydrochlorin chelatase [Streptomyces sp. NPDC097619]|uniref:sirohydrochlorin chelatase n=1 Tax=Streptomyces sp. NPDC097619 TaxID=3157228 RepID=UPI003318E5E1